MPVESQLVLLDARKVKIIYPNDLHYELPRMRRLNIIICAPHLQTKMPLLLILIMKIDSITK